MKSLTPELFDCLDAISDNGLLCQELDDNMKATGRFVARASSKVVPDHPGWPSSVVLSLYALRVLTKTSDGEYVITLRGQAACKEYRARRAQEAARELAQTRPDKVVFLNDFRKVKSS